MAPRSRTARLDGWRKSSTFRQIASRSAKANIKNFNAAPRCGATRKRDAASCCNPAMANGRCAIHGGKTPCGDQWHVLQCVDCSTPKGLAKFNAKLRRQETYAKKRAIRLAAMTPEQRARHEAWHRTHKPGSGVARSAEGIRARNDAEIRLLLSGDAPCRAQSPEFVRVRTALAVATAELARLEAKAAKLIDDSEGVFS